MPDYPYKPDIGQTDLMAAAYNGDAEEIARILAVPCAIDAQDIHGFTALMYAAMEGYPHVVHALVEHRAQLELQSKQRYTALMYAVRYNQIGCVKALLDAKANPNVHGDYDVFDTPLILAARGGFFSLVRLLVARGADIGLHGGYEQLTAECIARRQGHHDISEFLCYNERKPTA